MASRVDSSTPVNAPFQPGMRGADHAGASPSANSTGPQSAVEIARAMFRSRVTIPSWARSLASTAR